MAGEMKAYTNGLVRLVIKANEYMLIWLHIIFFLKYVVKEKLAENKLSVDKESWGFEKREEILKCCLNSWEFLPGNGDSIIWK